MKTFKQSREQKNAQFFSVAGKILQALLVILSAAGFYTVFGEGGIVFAVAAGFAGLLLQFTKDHFGSNYVLSFFDVKRTEARERLGQKKKSDLLETKTDKFYLFAYLICFGFDAFLGGQAVKSLLDLSSETVQKDLTAEASAKVDSVRKHWTDQMHQLDSGAKQLYNLSSWQGKVAGKAQKTLADLHAQKAGMQAAMAKDIERVQSEYAKMAKKQTDEGKISAWYGVAANIVFDLLCLLLVFGREYELYKHDLERFQDRRNQRSWQERQSKIVGQTGTAIGFQVTRGGKGPDASFECGPARACMNCGGMIPPNKRSDAVFCSEDCRGEYNRRQRKK